MNCPYCRFPDSRVKRTICGDSDRIPKELRGLNVLRRTRVCLDCRSTFHTIEITEEDFETLNNPGGHIFQPNPIV